MKTIVRKRVALDDAALEGTFPTEADYDLVVGGEDCEVRDADTGELVMRLVKNVIPAKVCRRVWRELRGKLKSLPDNRGMAAGKELRNEVYATGNRKVKNKKAADALTPSGRIKDARSQTLGFLDRTVRQPFCRQTAFTSEETKAWQATIPYAQHVDDVFAETLPAVHAFQMKEAGRASQDFVVPGTCFTTITVNRNWQCAYHKDRGDLAGSFGVMTIFRAGKYKGGMLVFPDWRLAVDYQTGDVLFANVHAWHGVTRMVGLKNHWERMTMVFYFRDGIRHCGTAREELERVKRRKAGDKLR